MYNLLNESFARLRKNKTFRVCLIIIIIIPVLIIGLTKFLTVQFDEEPSTMNAADDGLFFMTSMLPLFIAISPGLFIAKDFNQNTVRNKIICGYSRTAIYMTNWITSVCITFIFHIVSTIVSMGLISVLFEPGEIFTDVNIYYSLILIPVLISFSSITVAMTMIFRNTAGAIFSFFIHEISSLFILITLLIKSEALQKFLAFFLPMNQLQCIVSRNCNVLGVLDEDPEAFSRYAIPDGFDAAVIPLYAVILIIAVTALGIWHFNKKDIK